MNYNNLMSTRTYLTECLKEGRLVRWPDKAMPIQVYIAPFRWYEKSKQRESTGYSGMVLKALDAWSKASGGKVTFRVVHNLNDSQIDINWRRVDRTSLGHCEYMVNKQSMIYSAEIRIGISDGVIHSRYNNPDEVQHTIFHEVGHALGLAGHSPHKGDIMYVPHQYGNIHLSERDKETVRWLYKLSPGFDYQKTGKMRNIPTPFTLDDVIEELSGNTPDARKKKARTEHAPPPMKEKPEVLSHHHDILSNMGKFHLSTQNIQINPETRKLFVQQRFEQPEPDKRKKPSKKNRET